MRIDHDDLRRYQNRWQTPRVPRWINSDELRKDNRHVLVAVVLFCFFVVFVVAGIFS